MTARIPTAFVPHGGGPWPVMALPQLPEDERVALTDYMRSIAQVSPETPKALVVVSAHWEAPAFTVHRGAAPELLYDYYNFPDAAYQLRWPAPGHPEVADHVLSLLGDAGHETRTKTERGFDHGVFIPLLLAYPDANIPVVQVSLKHGLDPAEHYAMGEALAPLRDEGVFIIGSGNSYHNLSKFFGPNDDAVAHSNAFDQWLADAVSDPKVRSTALSDWPNAPAARECHPREEHLIPLMVAAGAANTDAGRVAWTGTMNGLRISAHHFG